MIDWIPNATRLPPLNETVDTKIDDGDGVRNEQQLRRIGRLWFFPDDDVYVYYTPTHWRSAEVVTR